MSLLKLDTNVKPIYAKTVEEFNDYVTKYSPDTYELILTKGNNISQKNLRNMPCSKTWKRGNHFEFQYIAYTDKPIHIRVLYTPRYEEEKEERSDPTISMKALNYFDGIMDVIPDDDHEEDTQVFTCPENPSSKYYNYINERYSNMMLDHCYSLDRNSAFLASMLKVYPKTKPWVDKYYADKLAGKTEIKAYDKIIIGWLNNPSKHRTHAWKKIIDDSNKTIHNLRMSLEDAGYEILLVNTDAVKYIAHSKFNIVTSKDLGCFKYEWQDTKMYVKGIKSYAYLDGDHWKFKQAGSCKLDLLKPNRDTWTLEDFKNHDTFKIKKVKIINDNYLGEYYG